MQNMNFMVTPAWPVGQGRWQSRNAGAIAAGLAVEKRAQRHVSVTINEVLTRTNHVD